MTKEEIQALIDSTYTGVGDRVRWTEGLKPILEQLNDGGLNIISVQDQNELITQPHTVSDLILVPLNGIFQAVETEDVPNNVNTFASADSGWIWQRVLTTNDGIANLQLSTLRQATVNNAFTTIDNVVTIAGGAHSSFPRWRILDFIMPTESRKSLRVIADFGTYPKADFYWQALNSPTGVTDLNSDFILEAFNLNDFILSNGGNRNVKIRTANVIRAVFNSGGLAIGAVSPAASAALDVQGTTKGFLSARLTTTQRNAIVSPAPMLQVSNITTNTNDTYDGVRWTSGAKILKGSATLDFPSTPAQSSSELTIVISGAVVGDAVIVGTEVDNPNSSFTARVSAADTVSVKFNNYSTAAIDPASGVFNVKLFKD